MSAWFGIFCKQPPPRWITYLANIEGYASFALALAVVVLPVSPGMHLKVSVYAILMIALGSGFGIGGIRFGEGGSRVAAWIAVVILSLLALVFGVALVYRDY